MSDDVKDFRYYADKAEASANEALFWAEDQLLNSRMFELYLRRSEMYARLAAGAPAAPLPGVCPCRLFPIPPNGGFKICILGAGHNGDHLTGDGIYFQD